MVFGKDSDAFAVRADIFNTYDFAIELIFLNMKFILVIITTASRALIQAF